MRLAAALNILKWWLVAGILAAFFGAFGWALAGPQTASVFVFCTLLAAVAVYAYADRALLGMLGAREYARGSISWAETRDERAAASVRTTVAKIFMWSTRL